MLATRQILILLTLFFVGCSNKNAQQPIIINIEPKFPPQYFPNSQIDKMNENNDFSYNEDDTFIQNIDINKKEVNNDIEKNTTK